MAHPSAPPPGDHHELSLNEARVRLAQLVRLTAAADQVTIISEGGRPAAALVPVAAAQSRAQAEVAAGHARATAAGWMQRLETVRADLRRQHAYEVRELERALAQAWQALDRLCPPGTDRGVDGLRAAHRHHLDGA